MSRLFWVVMAAIGGAALLLMLNNRQGQTFGVANDRFADMVWFGALGVLVGAGLWTRRTALPEMIRTFGIWTALALLLIGLYQFRYELQDVASRVSAGLVPGSPISTVDAEGRESVYVERAPGGHFEARARVNGMPVDVVVDTGASATVLTAADARKIGLDPDKMTFWVPVSTANGTATAARAEVQEISIGAISRRDVSVLVAQPGALDQSLLGMSFIGSLSGFDMRGDRLILRD